MKMAKKSVVCVALIGVAFVMTSCDMPELRIPSPPDVGLHFDPIAPTMAARIEWNTENPVQGPVTVLLDGQDISAQFHRSDFGGTQNDDAILTMPSGPHKLTASAQIFSESGGTFVTSTVVSNFTVAPPTFALNPLPVVRIAQGATLTVPVSVNRMAYTGDIGLLVFAGPGISSPGLVLTAGQSTGTLTFDASLTTGPGAFDLLIEANGNGQPSDMQFVHVQVGAAPTFTQIYANYFQQPSTPGHCFNCHQSPPAKNFFAPGPDQAGFYQGLVAAKLIDTANPAASRLIDPSTSPVRWFNPSGRMPLDNAVPNDQARSDITAWVLSGALDN